MILQDAIREFMKLSINEASKKMITIPGEESSNLRVGIDFMDIDPHPVLFDLEADAQRIKDGYYWCTLRIDEVLSEDWQIVDAK